MLSMLELGLCCVGMSVVMWSGTSDRSVPPPRSLRYSSYHGRYEANGGKERSLDYLGTIIIVMYGRRGESEASQKWSMTLSTRVRCMSQSPHCASSSGLLNGPYDHGFAQYCFDD